MSWIREAAGEWPRLAALFLLALGVRLLYVGSLPVDAPIASVDAWGYHRLAINVEAGHGFSLRRRPPFIPDSVRTPLYPLFLLLIRRSLSSSPRMAAIVQGVVDSFTAIITWGLAHCLGGRRAGRVAALLYALSPTQVRYVGELLTETLLSLLLTLSALVLVGFLHSARRSQKRWWLVLLGGLSGLAALCKPNAQFLPLIWLAGVVAARGRSRWLGDALSLLLPFCLTVSPWIVRNAHAFGRPFLSTAFEGNVSRVSAPATLAFAQGRYVPPWSAEWESLFGKIVSQAAARYRWRRPWNELDARELYIADHQVYLVAREVLARHPFAWVGSHAQGLLRYLEPQTFKACYARFTGREWPPDVLDDAIIHLLRAVLSGDVPAAWEIVADERWNRLSVAQRAVWWSTLVAQLAGSALVLRGAWRLRGVSPAALPLLMAACYLLALPGPIAYERFRVPVMGVLLALLSCGAGVICVASRSPVRQPEDVRRGQI